MAVKRWSCWFAPVGNVNVPKTYPLGMLDESTIEQRDYELKPIQQPNGTVVWDVVELWWDDELNMEVVK